MRSKWVLTAAAIALASGAAISPPAHAWSAVVRANAAFNVVNTNTSLTPCLSDGLPYTMRATLVAPASVLASAQPAVTIYIHGGTAGRETWDFREVPGMSWVDAMAARGHASLTLDLLAYGESDHPDGFMTCMGSAADTIHQVVTQLRAGTYHVDGRAPTAFSRVALVAHSGGGNVSEVEAASYHDVDVLSMVGSNGQPASPIVAKMGAHIAEVCGTGGEHANDDGTGPGGYAYVWPSKQDEINDIFYDIDPVVAAAVERHITRDACGGATLGEEILEDNILAPMVSVPVLVICGDHDDVATPRGCTLQAARYTASPESSLMFVPNAGHTFFLERSAPAARELMHAWLAIHGF